MSATIECAIRGRRYVEEEPFQREVVKEIASPPAAADSVILIASQTGACGMDVAIEVLRDGGSALDAVEAAARLVEANLDEHSVGVGGYPNALGEVELDASIMEGTWRRVGAVAALKGYPHPVSVARAILERLPQHVLLAGEGAARFACDCGFQKMELLTRDALAAWRQYRAEAAAESGGATFRTHEEIAESLSQSRRPPVAREDLVGEIRQAAERAPERTAGTVNFVARDRYGRIATAVSTSGWAFKYPGRVGDSPVIGAGNYCDDRFGACACTGLGEWSMRIALARQLVLRLEFGQSLPDACAATMRDLEQAPLPDGLKPIMNFVAFDARTGAHLSYSQTPGTTYLWQRPEMPVFERELCRQYSAL